MISEKVELYISWRDDLLKIIGEKICSKCTDPRKDKVTINIKDPLKCECHCEHINNVLNSVSKIDLDIKHLLNFNTSK